MVNTSDKRHSKTITNPKVIEYIASITEDDITPTFIMELFGEFDTGRKYNPYDIITIPAGKFGTQNKKNKTPFATTLRFIFLINIS